MCINRQTDKDVWDNETNSPTPLLFFAEQKLAVGGKDVTPDSWELWKTLYHQLGARFDLTFFVGFELQVTVHAWNNCSNSPHRPSRRHLLFWLCFIWLFTCDQIIIYVGGMWRHSHISLVPLFPVGLSLSMFSTYLLVFGVHVLVVFDLFVFDLVVVNLIVVVLATFDLDVLWLLWMYLIWLWLNCFVWFGCVWFGCGWFGCVWIGCVSFDCVWLGHSPFRCVWSGFVWFVSARFGLFDLGLFELVVLLVCASYSCYQTWDHVLHT